MVWRRPHVPSLSIPCKPKTHSGWMQNNPDTWRHNQNLKCLASALETRWIKTNGMPPPAFHLAPVRAFVLEGAKPAKVPTTADTGQLGGARDWKLVVDLNQRLYFPPKTAITDLWLDLVLWYLTLRSVYIIELTIPWEDAVGEAYECKSLKYMKLAADAKQHV